MTLQVVICLNKHLMELNEIRNYHPSFCSLHEIDSVLKIKQKKALCLSLLRGFGEICSHQTGACETINGMRA